MEITINRYWSNDNNAELLCKRPRVDYRISEYLFDFINRNILVKKKIMQSGKYDITLFMSIYNPEHFYDETYIYNTDKTKFHVSVYKLKMSVFCNSLLFNSKITPSEYADIVYDMFALYLLCRYKKLTKEIFDEAKKNLDYDCINSFEFPAQFDNQKYILDEGSVGIGNVRYDNEKKEWISDRIFTLREEYLKVFEK